MRLRLALIVTIIIGVLAWLSLRPERPVVYYLIPTLIDEWQTESQKAIEQFFSDKYDVISMDAESDQKRQNRQLKDVIDLSPAAIILNAVDVEGIDIDLIRAARRRGIIILNYDRVIAGVEVDFTSITDTQQTGIQAARAAIELLSDKQIQQTKMNPDLHGTVLQILGDPGDSWSSEVQIGFVTTMKENAPKVRIISRPAMQWDPENARKIVTRVLKEELSVDVIYAHAADLIVPVIDVLRTEFKKNSGDVILISSNGAPAGLKNIKDPPNWQQVEIEQPVYAQAYGLRLFLEGRLNSSTDLLKCRILGIEGELTRAGRNGPVLKLSPQEIRLDNVDNPRHWGNLVPPANFETQCGR